MKNKWIIIALSVAVAILLWLVLGKDDIIKTVTKTKIEYVPQVSNIEDTKPIFVKPIIIKVPGEVINNPGVTVRDTIWKEKEAKEYLYIDSLANGTITSKIIADNIYKRSVELRTLKEIVTHETTNTIVKNSIFFGVGFNKYSLTSRLRDVNLYIDFTNRDKWRVGVTGGYDFVVNDAFFGLKVGIPLN